MTKSGARREVDLSSFASDLRRYLLPLLLGTGLLSSGVYLWSRQQPTVYEAKSVMISINNATSNNGLLDRTLVPAPPLPPGAVAQAISSPDVVERIVNLVKRSKLPGAPQLAQDLLSELQSDRVRSINVYATEQYQGSIYQILGRAHTPQLAKLLTDSAVDSVIEWDTNRALMGVLRAQNSLKAQQQEIERLIKTTSGSEKTLLETQLMNTRRDIQQTVILAEAASGPLAKISAAYLPVQPVGPKPLQNAVLMAIACLLLGPLYLLLRNLFDRRIQSEEDLLSLEAPVLGVLPRLSRRALLGDGITNLTKQPLLYEALGFLRMRLMAQPKLDAARTYSSFVISSIAPGEGKSSVTAALAGGYALDGQRVLIIDADLRRGRQDAVWRGGSQNQASWKQAKGQGGARDLSSALGDPANVQVLGVSENVDLLPAGKGRNDSLTVLSQGGFGALLESLGSQYDVVLIDSVPILALADALAIAPSTDGILLIVEEGKTHMQAMDKAMRQLNRHGVQFIGFILNKSVTAVQSAYSYTSAQ